MKYALTCVLIAVSTALAQQPLLSPISNPSASGSIQPSLTVGSDGNVVLSWLEPRKDGSFSLRYAVRKAENWSAPRTVVAGRHFFRHPAEAPEVVMIAPSYWLAHWVEMPDERSEAEYIYVSSSVDGLRWTTPLIAHKDRKPVQHGLASLVGNSATEASLIWLEAANDEEGPTYLMRTVLDSKGKEVREERLDTDVCTCCPTSVAKTARGLIVAYRDHTPEDIRDISVLRLDGAQWSQPKTIGSDRWKINACPVNAASIALRGDRGIVAWYTGVQDSPKVQAVFTQDAGVSFSKPLVVSTGHAFGFTATTMIDDKTALVSWLERDASGQARVLVRKVSADGTLGAVFQTALSGKQGLGYPRVISSSNGAIAVWSLPGAPLQTARLAQ